MRALHKHRNDPVAPFLEKRLAHLMLPQALWHRQAHAQWRGLQHLRQLNFEQASG